jgi:hypothetical protein
MSFLVEAIKFRADVMKTIGYGLCSPLCAYLLFLISDYDSFVAKFNLLIFMVYILLTSIGAKCIIVAVKLLDMYSCNVKGLNQ